MPPLDPAPPQTNSEREILVWDIPTRAFHWLTAVLVLTAYFTWRFDRMDWHAICGDAVLTLVIFRLLWGFFGSDTTRFASFIARPRAALQHLAHLFRREPDHQVSHNPAGGLMVLLLLSFLLVETLSGLYVENDVVDEGPLTEHVAAPVANAITALHWIFWDGLLAAIALHLLTILAYAVAKGQDLLTPMITGKKRMPARIAQPRMASVIRAGFLLVASALIVAALAKFL
ncbi:MAG: cytochrome b/b6 domain-containing protein [Hyphomicrobiales bacterium]|nr:cytochrome b/b6 domain-containing protein [Hyphomicrobiales bacterium]